MCFFFFKQKTAYEMRISDWSSDVCSSDLACRAICMLSKDKVALSHKAETSSKFYDLVGGPVVQQQETKPWKVRISLRYQPNMPNWTNASSPNRAVHSPMKLCRSEEHTSELQSLMRISYAVFCLKKKIHQT